MAKERDIIQRLNTLAQMEKDCPHLLTMPDATSCSLCGGPGKRKVLSDVVRVKCYGILNEQTNEIFHDECGCDGKETMASTKMEDWLEAIPFLTLEHHKTNPNMALSAAEYTKPFGLGVQWWSAYYPCSTPGHNHDYHGMPESKHCTYGRAPDAFPALLIAVEKWVLLALQKAVSND